MNEQRGETANSIDTQFRMFIRHVNNNYMNTRCRQELSTETNPETHSSVLAKQLAIFATLAALLAAGCATTNPNLDDIHHQSNCKLATLRKCYVSASTGAERKDVPYANVVLLPGEPTDRKFQIIGYFSPIWQISMGGTAAISKAARGAAALYGADAFYFIDPVKRPGMSRHTAALIVWE